MSNKNYKDYKVPTTPFMIALGTSHTTGDCADNPDVIRDELQGGVVSKTAYEMVAEELGLTLVNIGLSGCKNKDLLQATNELAHYGFLNDNCKLFILEPRLVDATITATIEAVMGDRVYKSAPANTDDQWVLEDDSIVGHGVIEGWGRMRFYEKKIKGKDRYKATTSQEISVDLREHTSPSHKRCWYYEYENGNKAMEVARQYGAFYNNSPVQLLDHINIIDAIRNIVEANNIKFKWQLVVGEIGDLEISKKLIGNNTNLFDSFINIVAYESNSADRIGREYFCSCQHLNEKGHQYWYDITIKHLKEQDK